MEDSNINLMQKNSIKDIKINDFMFYLLLKLKDTKNSDKIINTLLLNNKRCRCSKNIKAGNNDNVKKLKVPNNIELFNWMGDVRKYYVFVDKCMVDEIKYLWSKNIPTDECCCGHNKLLPYIIVNPKYRKNMLELGYINQEHSRQENRIDLYFSQYLNKEIKWR